MKIRTSKILPVLLPLLIVALVFEESVYRWLPIGPTGYLIAKVWTEMTLYGLFASILAYRIYERDWRSFSATKFDVILIAFIILGVVSTLINHGSMSSGLLNIRTMLRYSAAYFIIVLAFHSDLGSLARRVIMFIIVIALFQSFLAVIQHFAGDDFTMRYFSPIDLGGGAVGLQKLPGGTSVKLGAAIGTFGKPAAMSFFLLVAAICCYAISLGKTGKFQLLWVVAYLGVLIGILFTYKRGSLLLALALPLVVPWLAGYRRLVLRNVSLGVLAVVILVGLYALFGDTIELKRTRETRASPVESLLMLTSSEYWNVSTKKSRGWVLIEVGGQALRSFKPIGYGADVLTAQTQMSKAGGEFAKLVGWGALDDVYIVATLVYFGPVGLALLLYCFFLVYRRARLLSTSPYSDTRALGVIVRALLILAFLGSFLERTLELRAFSFCLWTLSGLVVALARTEYLRLARDSSVTEMGAHAGSLSMRLLARPT